MQAILDELQRSAEEHLEVGAKYEAMGDASRAMQARAVSNMLYAILNGRKAFPILPIPTPEDIASAVKPRVNMVQLKEHQFRNAVENPHEEDTDKSIDWVIGANMALEEVYARDNSRAFIEGFVAAAKWIEAAPVNG